MQDDSFYQDSINSVVISLILAVVVVLEATGMLKFFFSEIAQPLKKRNGPSLELLFIVCACGHLQLVIHFQYSKNKLLLRYSTLFKQWSHWIPTDLLVNRF